jgi:hypothetical protein
MYIETEGQRGKEAGRQRHIEMERKRSKTKEKRRDGEINARGD